MTGACQESNDPYWGKRLWPLGLEDKNWFGKMMTELRDTMLETEDDDSS
jgi:hypothetical protein